MPTLTVHIETGRATSFGHGDLAGFLLLQKALTVYIDSSQRAGSIVSV